MHLCIDAADDRPGIALARDGQVIAQHVWETKRNHSVELLPNVDRLIADAGATKGALGAVFVDIGPGGYAALRVGVSVAKAIAHGLAIPIAGIGRLELDARLAGAAEGRRVVAVHRAGRGEYAWAAYARRDGAW
ncbi:MAG TPA: tRNA (adenosine(37)-N6)-threonylcarbamoyltransferase complex dimerization subunit type 1 TsaB, partial [Dehalococcoidia bacterium]|nr:tRNA (adenosine(37)-N6)-threonylcarbamoyltransferase complex dimerization subunit type 1 TsaB [Dehalococcoidia bacterium]